MKSYFLLNAGLEQSTQTEIFELTKKNSTIHPLVVETDLSKEQLLTALERSQLARRILCAITQTKDIETIDLNKIDFDWSDFFVSNLSFKVEVEGLSGNDNRMKIAKNIATKIHHIIEEKNRFMPKIELKKPDILIVVFFNGQDYFIGIDLAGFELNARAYRVFPHQASFKGDIGYFFVRSSSYQKGQKMLVAFCKDGTLAIEAGLWNSEKPVRPKNKNTFALFKYPLFQSILSHPVRSPEENEAVTKEIIAFDESKQNIIASLKNASLAGVKQHLTFHQCFLDDLDLKFDAGEFEIILFQLTSKDEEKINEIYRQTSILKSKGLLYFITRKAFDLPLSEKFNLIKKEEIKRGDCEYITWLLEKK
jgi:23S rRNA G2445 N2-methylase RlmL